MSSTVIKEIYILFRSIDHFYTIVKFLNKNVGIGLWRAENGILRQLKVGRQVSKKLSFFRDVNDECLTLLTLL